MDWFAFASVVLAVIAIVAGVYWVKAKRVIKEVAELLTAISDAVEDDDVTKDELKKIVEEFGDVIASVVK